MHKLCTTCQPGEILLTLYGIYSPLQNQIAKHLPASLQIMYCVTAESIVVGFDF